MLSLVVSEIIQVAYIDNAIKGILNREGGFVNNPKDPGGATKYGITLNTLKAWRNKTTSVEDVRNLSIEEATQIYKKRYFEGPGILKIGDEILAEQVIDAAVNHGTGTAIEMLQEAVGADIDGGIGPNTIGKVGQTKKYIAYFNFMAIRLRYYATIIDHNHELQEFAAGWMNRCATMLEIYVKAVDFEDSIEKPLWETAVYLREQAKELSHDKPLRAHSSKLFRKAASKLELNFIQPV